MNIQYLEEFFMWMTVINFGLLLFFGIMSMAAKELIQRVHGRLFGLAPETINAFLYGYLGVYKIMFIICVLVPWLALKIMN